MKGIYGMDKAVFVQFDNTLWYKNPTLIGDNWYIYFDDTTIPKILIRKGSKPEMGNILKDISLIGMEILNGNWEECKAVFPPFDEWNPEPALRNSLKFKKLLQRIKSCKIEPEQIYNTKPQCIGHFIR